MDLKMIDSKKTEIRFCDFSCILIRKERLSKFDCGRENFLVVEWLKNA